MSEWRTVQLGEVVNFKNGFAFKSSDFIDSGIPVIKIKNVKPNRINLNDLSYVSESVARGKEKYFVEPSDILISMSGNRSDGSPDSWVGKVSKFRLKGAYLLNQRVSIIQSKEGLSDSDFLAYNLSSWETQQYLIGHANSSGGQANISPSTVKAMEVILPPLPEQKAIAAVLSSLDDKIDLLHRQNNTLEAMAETLFRQWFVVEAQEDWEEKSLLDLIELVGGGTPKTSMSEYWDGDIPWLSGGDIATNHKGFASLSEKTITKAGLENSSAKLLPKFATVISARGTVGKYCLLASEMAFSQSNYGILPRIKDCYLFTYLLVNHVVEELQSAAYGSVFDTITTSTFREAKFAVPPVAKVLEFEDFIASYFDKKLVNQTQIRTLEKLRDNLLPKLMSGEVRVAA